VQLWRESDILNRFVEKVKQGIWASVMHGFAFDWPATEVAPLEPAAGRPPVGTVPNVSSPQGDGRRNAPPARFQSPAQNAASHPFEVGDWLLG
jgi:hypothetical protein